MKSSNGTVFQVAVNERLDAGKLRPGARVAMNQDSLAIIELLHDAWDPMVSGAEMIEAPDISYSDVAGLEDEIMLVKEAVELPLKNPGLFTKVGVTPPKGVLLVGPPDAGKPCSPKPSQTRRKPPSYVWWAVNWPRSTSVKAVVW